MMTLVTTVRETDAKRRTEIVIVQRESPIVSIVIVGIRTIAQIDLGIMTAEATIKVPEEAFAETITDQKLQDKEVRRSIDATRKPMIDIGKHAE
jgi:hypothetical protein